MKTPSTMDRDALFYMVKFTVKQYTAPHDIVISGVVPLALCETLKPMSNNCDFSVGFASVIKCGGGNGVVEGPVLQQR
jgi:hypothetical protein